MELMQGIQYGWDSWEETNDISDSYNPLPLDSPEIYATGIHLLLQTSPIIPLVKIKKEKRNTCPYTHHEGTHGEQRHSSTHFLILLLDGGEWSVSPLLLYPKQRTLHLLKSMMDGPQKWSEWLEKRQIFCPW